MWLHTICHLTSFHHDFNSLMACGAVCYRTPSSFLSTALHEIMLFLYPMPWSALLCTQTKLHTSSPILRYRLPYKANVKFPYEPFVQMDTLLKCIMMSLDIPHDSLSFCLSVLDHSDQQFLRSVPAAPHSSRRSDLDSHLCHLHKHQLCQHQGPQLTVGEHECYW